MLFKKKSISTAPTPAIDPIQSMAERLSQLAADANELTGCLEETAKMQLVANFLDVFGWNLNDHKQCAMEKTTGKKKRADIMLYDNGTIKIVIEVKRPGAKLEQFTEQLANYFNNCQASVGILTDGVKYWFFSYADTPKDKGSYMNEIPFATVSLNSINLKKQDAFLLDLCKDNFNVQNLIDYSNSDYIRAKIYGLIGSASNETVKQTIRSIYLTKYPGYTSDRIDKMIDFTRYHSRYNFRHGKE